MAPAPKLVKARYIGSAPARLDPDGIQLVPGETVVEIPADHAEPPLWEPVKSSKAKAGDE